MDFYQFSPDTVLNFLMTLFRISLILFVLPFFGGEGTPVPVKAALCLVLALALFPSLQFSGVKFPAHPFNIVLMLAGELVLGLVLGLVVMFIFAAVRTGGQLIGFQMGFSMVNVMDPDTGASESVTSHFLNMVVLLTFLSLNGHLMLLQVLVDSFTLVPPGGLFLSPALTKGVLELSGQMFSLGIKVAAPVVASLFLVDLALALVSRAAPQMNILMLGFPLKITVGFLFLSLLFTVLAHYIKDFMAKMMPMYQLILTLAGSAPTP